MAGGYALDLRVPPELECFAGHFPGMPLLPGVVQVEWAVALAQPRFALPPRFSHIAALKFMRVIQPGETLVLELGFDASRGELGFTYRDSQGRECSSGRIGFSADV